MSYYSEIWTRPGAPAFGRVIDDVPTAYQSFHDGFNLLGDGSMQIPNTFDRFDEILFIDPNTIANCYSGLVRIFDDSDPTTPVFEWLPRSILPTTTKGDPNVDVGGRGIKSILNYAVTEANDWDGSVDFAPAAPDWIYGGDNVLTNGGLEASIDSSTVYILQITATGGSFTLTDGTDTTSAISSPFTDLATTIETRLEADIASISDVAVARSSSSPPTYIIQLVTPPFGVTLTVNVGSLTGGTAELVAEETGFANPAPWTIETNFANLPPPPTDIWPTFEVSAEQAHSGSYSLKVLANDPQPISGRNPGVQQIVNVTPGQIYQASVWIYPTSATDQFRLYVATPGEETIGINSIGTLTANTWNEITISDFTVPTNVSEVAFRVDQPNPYPVTLSTYYLDDAELNPGLAATTVGAILGDLHADATTDHAGRVVWEDEANPGTPYLTLDFDDSVDSNGATWVDSEISVRIWMRMTYLQVMEQFATTYGYEWRIVPDDVEAGTWLWQVYNPGTMKTDYTAAASPAIQGGSQDVSRQILRVLPTGTHAMVEGEARITSRYTETTLEAALGRIESARIDRELPLLSAIQAAAYSDANDFVIDGLAYTYELVDPQDIPLVAYQIGDLLTIHDPPEVEDTARLMDVEVVMLPSQQLIEVQFAPATAAGS